MQGVKLQYGHVPVGARGDDEGGRRFASLHAVQRHMVDTNQVTAVVTPGLVASEFRSTTPCK